MLNEPLAPAEAKRLIRDILAAGRLRFSTHAEEEMAKDDITGPEAINVLRAGVVEPAEWDARRREWRYRVRAAHLYVVVTFLSETRLRVVTAWRARG